ncbi:MAG: hypothetical protein R6W92_12180 [Desulfocurvibacter africanus]
MRTRLFPWLPVVLLSALFLSGVPGALAATTAPKTLAAYTLGQDISAAAEYLDMDSAQTIWNQEWFKQVEVKNLPGFRNGYLIYGNCNMPGKILRIKLKYDDSSLAFFERLQKILQDRYGRGEWRGDPFGTLHSWKWGFTDEKGDSISVILQHYSGADTSYTEGNSIRLANRSSLTREKACGEAKEKDEGRQQDKGIVPSFDWYLPK